jgi:hypothetical protein
MQIERVHEPDLESELEIILQAAFIERAEIEQGPRQLYRLGLDGDAEKCVLLLVYLSRLVADDAAGPELLVDIFNRLQRRFLVSIVRGVVSALDPVRQIEIGFPRDLQRGFLYVAVTLENDVAAGLPSSVKTGHSSSSSSVKARSGTMWILPSKRNGREKRPAMHMSSICCCTFFSISARRRRSIGNGPSSFRRYR